MLNYEKEQRICRWKEVAARTFDAPKMKLEEIHKMVIAGFSKHKIMSEFPFLLIKKKKDK